MKKRMNNLEEMEIFPTPVTIVSNFLDKEERNNLISYAKDNISFVAHSALSGDSKSTYSTHKSVLSSYNIDLAKKIELEIIKVAKRMGLPDPILSNSWINIQTKNTILKPHNHSNNRDCIISGAIYLKVDDDSSKLYFYNPNPYISMYYFKNQNKFNHECVWIQPKNGDLILFPSWLKHGSDDINKTKERIVLSFNGDF